MNALPRELDLPPRHGFTMKGWDFTSAEVADAIRSHRMLNPAMELGTNTCPWNCSFCFTESPDNPDGLKRRLANELSIERRLRLIDEAAVLGARSINFVGAGEPTIDPHFWELIGRMNEREITPIIYTEGSLKLSDRDFASRLFETGCTIVLKVNSLSAADYQDSIVRGSSTKGNMPTFGYSERREVALQNLFELGFNRTHPTRMAFDTIICQQNLAEIESIHRFARLNNIFVLFVNYLPSGRTEHGHTTAIGWKEQHAVFRSLAEIDEKEFGMRHATVFPYAGGVPCTIRGLGLFTKIEGAVFDCPGESISLGNLRDESLADVWNKAGLITKGWNGGCFPRMQFWKAQGGEFPTLA